MLRRQQLENAQEAEKKDYRSWEEPASSSSNEEDEFTDSASSSGSLSSTQEQPVKSQYAGRLDNVDHVQPSKQKTNTVEESQIEGLNLFLRRNLVDLLGNEADYEGSKLFRGNANNNNLNPPWQSSVPPRASGLSIPPSAYTVTQIRHTHDLLRVGGAPHDVGPVTSADQQTSSEWLQSHSLEAKGLTVANLLSRGTVGEPAPDVVTGKPQQYLNFPANVVVEFEFQVHLAIEEFTNRVKWCLQGSRRSFGLVRGFRVAVLLDCSEANLGFGRRLGLSQNLMHFVDEQLSKKSMLYLMKFGTDLNTLWPTPMDVNVRTREEALQYFNDLQPMGGCNVLKAIKQVVKMQNIDLIVLILGSLPDQNPEILDGFLEELFVGRKLPLHTVGYDCPDHLTNSMLRRVSAATGGVFHCFSTTSEEKIYTSTDIALLLAEIEAAQVLLSKLQDMRRGVLDDHLVNILSEISNELESIPQSQFLPRPPGHDRPLRLSNVSEDKSHTSQDWLKDHGLKGKKMDLYQGKSSRYSNSSRVSRRKSRKSRSECRTKSKRVSILSCNDNAARRKGRSRSARKSPKRPKSGSPSSGTSSRSGNSPLTVGHASSKDVCPAFTSRKLNSRPNEPGSIIGILAPNAYNYLDKYVPSIQKTVTSQVHEKAMVQFEWHDGSVKNVHVDLAELFEYQKQLGAEVQGIERRINWLASGSRRIFGTIVEERVVFLVDLSVSNVNYLVHIQHSLRLLLEQQVYQKEFFNIIGFGSNVQIFSKKMVPATEKNLQKAWNWIMNLQCFGSRNLLAALRAAVENDEELKHQIYVEGMYLFTSGIPDQSVEQCAAYLEEVTCGRPMQLHTVLFNVDDYDATGCPIPGRYANITKTADALRYLAHCTGGRFHWFRETGIIESDDIRLLMVEIDKIVNYSKKCKLLIDTLKSKYPDSEKRAIEKQLEWERRQRKRETERALLAKAAGVNTGSNALPAPKETNATRLRKQKLEKDRQDADSVPKALAYRGPQTPDPLQSVRAAGGNFRPPVKSAFYTESKHSKGVAFQGRTDASGGQEQAPRNKGVGRCDIPDREERLTTKDWMRRYSLTKMGLNLLLMVSGPQCRHNEKLVGPLNKYVEAKYCAGLFPTVNIRGTLRHMQYTPLEMLKYEREVHHSLRRYVKRLEWLCSGSRRVFGLVVEARAVFLIDVSGSMEARMDELKESLKLLVWEQLYKEGVHFNLIAFSSSVKCWRDCLAQPTEATCHEAVAWIDALQCGGNTDTLLALKVALCPSISSNNTAKVRSAPSEGDPEAVYLLSDGKPDCSTTTVLEWVNQWAEDRYVDASVIKKRLAISTISFNCEDETANTFLHQLAHQEATRGRYHKVSEGQEVQLFAHRLRTVLDAKAAALSTNEGQPNYFDPEDPPLPALDGDDLRRLMREITAARRYIAQCNYFKDLYWQCKQLQKEQIEKANAAVQQQQRS